jgi:hypothetical protein
MDGEMLEQNLKCPICFNIVEEPFETSCCGHLFCNKCIKGIKKMSCPICRSNRVNFRENSFVKNLLNTMCSKCPYGCGSSIPLGNIKYHRYQCKVSIFKCSMLINGNKCDFEGTKIESMKHFASSHSDNMMMLAEHFSRLKNSYDKLSMFEKLNKITNTEKLEKDSYSFFKSEEEYNDYYLKEIINNNIKKKDNSSKVCNKNIKSNENIK